MKTSIIQSLGAPLIAGAVALAAFAPATSAQTWIRDITSAGHEAAGIAVRDDGIVALVGRRGAYGSVSLFNAMGSQVSGYDLTTFDSLDIVLHDGLFLDDGSLAVCGSIDGQPWVAALDALTGIPLWDTTLTDDSGEGWIERMVVNDIGHLVLQGQLRELTSTESFLAAVKPESNGTTVYRRVIGSEVPTSITLASNGELILASYTGEAYVTRTNNFANEVWRQRYDAPNDLLVPRLVETTNGDLMSVGLYREGQNDFHFWAMKTDKDGAPLWHRVFSSFPSTTFGKTHIVYAAVPTADGGIVAAVTQPMPGDGSRDAALLRLDSDGNVMWLQPLGIAGVDDQAVDLEQTPDGGFVVAVNAVDSGVRIARLDANGKAGSCPIHPIAAIEQPAPVATAASDSFTYTSYDGLWGAHSVTPFGLVAFVTNVCGEVCSTSTMKYGVGTAGTGGFVPQLNVSDGVCLGYTPELQVHNVVGNTVGLVFVGFGPGNVSAMGGTFLIDPSQFFAFPTSVSGLNGVGGTGSASYPMGTDLTPLSGFTLHMQTVFADSAGPTGKTLSNAVTLSIQ